MFYCWREKYRGTEAGVATPLRAFEAETAKLKRIAADRMLEMSAITNLLQNYL